MRDVEAQAFAYALEYGAVPLEDVREWADHRITDTASPAEEIFELSLASNVPVAIGLLHRLGQDADRGAVSRRVFGHLHSGMTAHRISHQQAAGVLERLANEGAAPSQYAESEMRRFDDALYLAEIGTYGDPCEIKSELEAFLRENAA